MIPPVGYNNKYQCMPEYYLRLTIIKNTNARVLVASDSKSSLRLEGLPQTRRVASDSKGCLRLEGLLQTRKVASDSKSRLRL